MSFLTVLTYLVLSFVSGILLIIVPSGILPAEKLIDNFNRLTFSSNLALVLTGLLIVLLCLRYIQKFIFGFRQNKNISFESKEGKVNITLGAIEDLLKKMLEAKDEVSHTKVRVGLKRKIVEVKIKGYLNYEVNLVSFTKEIQEKVKEKLEILLGEGKKVKVSLQIGKISAPSSKVESQEQTEVPFRNYQ